jgi:hypothetical protein
VRTLRGFEDFKGVARSWTGVLQPGLGVGSGSLKTAVSAPASKFSMSKATSAAEVRCESCFNKLRD